MWLSLLIAALVLLFGAYRLWLAFGGPPDEERAKARRGMLAMPRRQHGAIGILYLLVGSALLATSFGFNPFRKQEAAAPTAPASKDKPTAIPVAP
ncbi:MAG TPA: hypothetical protein VM734_25955 [Kofleriaceae bacterium]|nr:hypothetical protein [Kofleriaceae bacterium]